MSLSYSHLDYTLFLISLLPKNQRSKCAGTRKRLIAPCCLSPPHPPLPGLCCTPTEAHWVQRSKFGRFSQPWGREAPTSTLQAQRDMSVLVLQQSKTVSKPLLLTDKHLYFSLGFRNTKQAFPWNSWKTIFEQDLKIFCCPCICLTSVPQDRGYGGTW